MAIAGPGASCSFSGSDPQDGWLLYAPSNNGIATFSLNDIQNISGTDPAGNANKCIFDQANDGQLDFARDYLRFGLMTFDNLYGLSTLSPASTCFLLSARNAFLVM